MRVGRVYATLEKWSPEEREWLNGFLSFTDEKSRFTGSTNNLFDPIANTFPAGLLRNVQREAETVGFPFEVLTDLGPALARDPDAPMGWLRDYQRDAVAAVLEHERGIIKAPTGSGKTEIIIALTHALPVRWLVLAPRAQLVEQIADRYQLRTPGVPIGRVGEGRWNVPDDAHVVVATYQSLYTDMQGGGTRAARLLDGAQALACDEAHTAAADTFWRVAMRATNARVRVGFSGTPLDRGDRRNVLVIAALGRVIYKIPFETLAAAGVLVRPEITMVECVHPMYDSPTWQGVYGKAIVKSPARNRVLVEAARRAEKPALLFVKELKHGKALVKALARVGVRADFVWGNHSVDHRNTKIRDVVAGRLDVLVCSVVFQEGIDVPDLRSVIVGAGGRSVIAAIQRVGRGTRTAKGKTSFSVFDVADEGCGCRLADGHQSCKWLATHSRMRANAYQREGYAVTRETWVSAADAGG